jgi:hypothetical protein
MTLVIRTFCLMTHSIMTFCIMSHSITKDSIMTIIKTVNKTGHSAQRHPALVSQMLVVANEPFMPRVIVLNVVLLSVVVVTPLKCTFP